MVDVGGDDRATAGDFLTDKLGGDFLGNAGAKAMTWMLLVQQACGAGLLQLHVLADGNVFHLGGDDALTRIVHLADVSADLGPAWVTHVGETQLGQLGIGQALLTEVRRQPGQALGVTTGINPGGAHIAKAFTHINDDGWIGVRAGSVVDQHGRVGFTTEVGRRIVQADFTHRYTDVRVRAFDINFARTGERLYGLLIDLGRLTQIGKVFFLFTHHRLSRRLPSSGMSGRT
ncbi:hypothetical protein D3C80_583870 [compost metagenome]